MADPAHSQGEVGRLGWLFTIALIEVLEVGWGGEFPAFAIHVLFPSAVQER